MTEFAQNCNIKVKKAKKNNANMMMKLMIFFYFVTTVLSCLPYYFLIVCENDDRGTFEPDIPRSMQQCFTNYTMIHQESLFYLN